MLLDTVDYRRAILDVNSRTYVDFSNMTKLKASLKSGENRILYPVETMSSKPNCPECGGPLSRKSCKSRYHCDNDNCPVIYVRYPHIPAMTIIVYKSSATKRNPRPQEALVKI